MGKRSEVRGHCPWSAGPVQIKASLLNEVHAPNASNNYARKRISVCAAHLVQYTGANIPGCPVGSFPSWLDWLIHMTHLINVDTCVVGNCPVGTRPVGNYPVGCCSGWLAVLLVDSCTVGTGQLSSWQLSWHSLYDLLLPLTWEKLWVSFEEKAVRCIVIPPTHDFLLFDRIRAMKCFVWLCCAYFQGGDFIRGTPRYFWPREKRWWNQITINTHRHAWCDVAKCEVET